MKTSTQKALASMLIGAATVVSQTPIASAGTYTMQGSKITVNGSVLSQPPKFVYQNTTYMPIYYVNTVLQKLGFATTWDGHNWGINGSATNAGLYLNAQSGQANIYLNGTLTAAHVVMVQTTDPYSHNLTTFMPIWYVQQVLDSVLKMDKTTDVWDGTSWALSTTATGGLSNGGTTDQQHALSIYNSITWSTKGNYRVFSAPILPKNSWWELVISVGTAADVTQYSLDNGSTWHTAHADYDSFDLTQGGVTTVPAGVSHVLVRGPASDTTYIQVIQIGSTSDTTYGGMNVSNTGVKSLNLNLYNQ